MAQETLSRNQWRTVDQTISPEEVGKLNFIPIGNFVIVESIKPETVSPGGLHVIHTHQDRPIYRVLRFNEDGFHSAHFREHVKLGSVVRSVAQSALTVPHELPRLGDGTYRRLFLLSSDTIDCVFTDAKGWTEIERKAASDMENLDPRTVFTQDVINKTKTHMLSKEEAAKIAYQPIGSKVIVENAPFKARTSSGIEIGGGRGEPVPAYRVLKKDPTFQFSGPLANLREGDFVFLMGVMQSDLIPHELKDTHGNRKELYLVESGMIAAIFPNLHWDEIDQWYVDDESNVTIDVEDTLTVGERLVEC